MRVDHVEAILRTRRPRFIYTMPSMHNPTGVTMSARAPRTAGHARAPARRPVIEDDPYGELARAPSRRCTRAIPSTSCTSRRSRRRSRPRCGWAGWSRRARSTTGCCCASSRSTWRPRCTSKPACAITSSAATTRTSPRCAPSSRERRAIAHAAIAEHWPAGLRAQPGGDGYYLWATAPRELRARALLANAERRGVSFLFGEAFFAQSGGDHNFRLALTPVPRNAIAEGIRRIGGGGAAERVSVACAARLVRAPRTPASAVARDARSVSHRGERDDAAADAGRARDPALRRVRRALSRRSPRSPRPRPATSCARGAGSATTAGRCGCTRSRARSSSGTAAPSARRGGAARAAGDRRVHRRRRPRVRVRARRRGARRERAARRPSRRASGSSIRRSPATRALDALALAAVPPGAAHDWNSAMMDLGATLCTARAREVSGLPAARGVRRGAGRSPRRSRGARARTHRASRRRARSRSSERSVFCAGAIIDRLRDVHRRRDARRSTRSRRELAPIVSGDRLHGDPRRRRRARARRDRRAAGEGVRLR